MTAALIKTGLFSILLLTIYFLVAYLGIDTYIHASMPWIILFYLIQNSMIHLLAFLFSGQQDNGFPMLVIAGFSIRLITALMAVVMVVSIFGIESELIFIYNFFAVYLLYLVFDIVSTLSNLRSNLK